MNYICILNFIYVYMKEVYICIEKIERYTSGLLMVVISVMWANRRLLYFFLYKSTLFFFSFNKHVYCFCKCKNNERRENDV